VWCRPTGPRVFVQDRDGSPPRGASEDHVRFRRDEERGSDVLLFAFQNNADINVWHDTGSLTASGVSLTILP
jgi:hypothetical protein